MPQNLKKKKKRKTVNPISLLKIQRHGLVHLFGSHLWVQAYRDTWAHRMSHSDSTMVSLISWKQSNQSLKLRVCVSHTHTWGGWDGMGTDRDISKRHCIECSAPDTIESEPTHFIAALSWLFSIPVMHSFTHICLFKREWPAGAEHVEHSGAIWEHLSIGHLYSLAHPLLSVMRGFAWPCLHHGQVCVSPHIPACRAS